MVLDEGGMILDEPISGAKGTFAIVGIGEKGCADLKFIARSLTARLRVLLLKFLLFRQQLCRLCHFLYR